MQKIDSNTIIKRSSNVVDTEVDEQTVFMNVNEGMYFSANKVGSKIWSLLENPSTLDELCQKLAEIYAVDTVPTYREEVTAYINTLVKKKLVAIVTP